MQPAGVAEWRGIVPQDFAASRRLPWLLRLLDKLVLDILPAASASVFGGLLLAHYQFGHPAAPRPFGEEAEPASAEMMTMVRDEHAAIMAYLNSQIAAERGRDLAADAELARAAADAKAAAEARAAADQAPAADAAMTRSAASAVAAKAVHGKAAPPHAPLVIAQAQPVDNGAIAAGNAPASDPDSLLAKTLDIKDHVVAVTRHAASVIADAFAAVGARIGSALPSGRQFASAS